MSGRSLVATRRDVESSLSTLGLHTEVRHAALDKELPAFSAEHDQWRALASAQDPRVIARDLWQDFPAEQPWTGLEVVCFGQRLDSGIPDGSRDRLLGDMHALGVIFVDCSVLTWRQVAWVHGEEVHVVQETLHYQRRGPKGQTDWFCRYDFRPLRSQDERRDYVSQPVHHVHIGRLDDPESCHFPSGPLDLWTMLRWVAHAFPRTVDRDVRQRLCEEPEGLQRALRRRFPLVCKQPPFP